MLLNFSVFLQKFEYFKISSVFKFPGPLPIPVIVESIQLTPLLRAKREFFKAKFKPRIINANWALDLIVDNIFRKKKEGIYIDVGCHHPFINNNTYLLYKKGWKGISCEALKDSVFTEVNITVNLSKEGKNSEELLSFWTVQIDGRWYLFSM